MVEDKEIAAMSAVVGALEELDEEARERVLRWVSGRYRVELTPSKQHAGKAGPPILEPGHTEFEDFASLFNAADPKTEPEKALVAGYWFQVPQGQAQLDAQPINTALKNLGHGIGNITDALTSLKDRKPALILQLQKSGNSKQARKKYKLTTTGIDSVKAMLSGRHIDEE